MARHRGAPQTVVQLISASQLSCDIAYFVLRIWSNLLFIHAKRKYNNLQSKIDFFVDPQSYQRVLAEWRDLETGKLSKSVQERGLLVLQGLEMSFLRGNKIIWCNFCLNWLMLHSHFNYCEILVQKENIIYNKVFFRMKQSSRIFFHPLLFGFIFPGTRIWERRGPGPVTQARPQALHPLAPLRVQVWTQQPQDPPFPTRRPPIAQGGKGTG